MSHSIFQSPVKVIYGIGSITAVGKEAVNYGKKVMIVTGRNSSKKLVHFRR